MSLDSASTEVSPEPRQREHESFAGGFFSHVTNTRISVELLTDMRSSRMRWSSRRVVLRASITSVILLTVAFIITYSVLLSYISNRAPIMRRDTWSERSKSGKRTKFLPRPFEVFGGGHIVRMTEDTVVKWNIEEYIDRFIEKPQCEKGSKILIIITSSPENSDRRKSIRDTWCSQRNFNMSRNLWQCIFLIGHNSHQSSQVIVEREAREYGDILIGSYIDSYRNLTIKVIHGLHWASNMCPNHYVLKTDDDVYVNTRILLNVLDTDTPKQNVYIGLVMNSQERLEVIRNPLNKWVVSVSEYSPSHYPPYASGMGYLLSSDVVSRMVNLSKYVTVIPNEDAYIGVLADRLDVEPYRSGRFTLTGAGVRVCNFMYIIVIHHITAAEQYEMLEKNLQAPRQCTYDTEDYLQW